MNDWTWRRKASFFIHAYFVAIPFGLSTGSALLFWYDLFQLWGIAILMVCSVEVLALTGLILSVCKITSPFVILRHLLPFISIVPLGRELYLLLEHNGWFAAAALALVCVAILVVIAWKCFATIEGLFIDPIEAAREHARARVEGFKVELARLEEMNTIVDRFAVERMRYHAPTVTTVHAEIPALPSESPAFQSATSKALYPCKKCGRMDLTFDELGRHSRGCKEEVHL